MKSFIRSLTALAISALAVAGVSADMPSRLKVRPQTVVSQKLTASPEHVLERKIAKKSNFANQGRLQNDVNAPVRMKSAPRHAAAAATDMPEIYGCVFYSNKSGLDQTLCRIPTNSSEAFEVKFSGVNAIDGGTAVGNTYFAAYHTEYYGEYKLYVTGYDIETGSKTIERIGDASAEATDVAYNPVDGKVYGCFCDPDSPDYSDYYFGTIDYTTGVATRIADLPRQLAAIAIDAAGKIYVIDKQQEKVGYSLTTVGADLYTIDAATGEMTLIGKTGLKPEYRSSACIDPATGRMFWVVNPTDECGYLYEVDTKTGFTTLVYQFPDDEEVVGMYIAGSNATVGLPAAVSDLTVSFPGGAMQGKASFTMPSADELGNPVSGLMSWKLSTNGTVRAQGTAAAGEKVEATVTLPVEGLYEFSLTVSNDSGISAPAKLTVYVGHDTPSTPAVSVSADGNNVTVSWEPVTTTVNGGYIDPASVTYKVTRMPDIIVVAEGIRETTATDVVPAFEGVAAYTYEVTATCGERTSDKGVSPKLILGHETAPFTDDFSNSADMEKYTVIDVNGDGISWGPYIGNVQVVYNSAMAMDDWFITPPVMLEKGKAYRFSVDVLTGSATAPEKFEIKYGSSNTVEAMTETVVPLQSVSHTEYRTYGDYISPAETGLYYIGIHGCSDADMYTISIDNLTVSEGIQGGAPAAPSALEVTSRTNGELRADISVTAPAVDIIGNELKELEKLVVLRDGTEIKTFSNPTPGETLTFTDDVTACEFYTYSAYAVNADGEGSAVESRVYVGVLEPENPAGVEMTEIEPGVVRVSWTAPAADINGNALDPQYVTYRIYVRGSSQYDLLAKDIKETHTEIVVLDDPSTQVFAQFLVVAETLGGISDGIPTPMSPVGKAYAAPYRESFANAVPGSILGSNTGGGASWGLFNDTENITSFDGDNGFIGCVAQHLDDYATLLLGKIDLAGLESPALSFFTYNITSGSDVDENELEINIVCEGKTENVENIRIADLGTEEGWYRVIVPLDAFKGKTIQPLITAYGRIFSYTLIDAIRVDNVVDHNLTVVEVKAPATVKAGTGYTVAAVVENNGTEDAEGFTVELYCDDNKVAEQDGGTLRTFSKKSYEFVLDMPVIAVDAVSLSAKVVYSKDKNPADNTCGGSTVTPVPSTLPYVTDLSAAVTGDGVVLSWSTPDFSTYIPDAKTEDFENMTSWSSTETGDWTFVDRDGAGIGGFSDGTAFPGIAANSVQSFWVFDNTTEGYNDIFFTSHSGHKYAGQMYSFKAGAAAQCDDWMISPELLGAEQTVSFFARAFESSYSESFEVLASTGSTDPADFTLVAAATAETDEWTLYTFTLPEGSRRFAIRCVSYDRYMFLVDDITFIPAADSSDLELTGYNIYRDNALIGSADGTSFTDTTAEADKDYSYKVTAVFTKGESRPSQAVNIATSGVEGVGAGISVSTGRGTVTVCGAEGMRIALTAVDGRTVAVAGNASPKETFNVAAGVYIVQLPEAAVKVVVK